MKKYILVAFIMLTQFCYSQQTGVNNYWNFGGVLSYKGYSSSIINTLTSGVNDTLFSVSFPADSSFNSIVSYGIWATDNDTTQSEVGVLLISAVNYNGTLQYSFTTLGSTQPTGILGTLSKSLSCSLASSVLYCLISVTSSISPSTFILRATPNIHSSYIITKYK